MSQSSTTLPVYECPACTAEFIWARSGSSRTQEFDADRQSCPVCGEVVDKSLQSAAWDVLLDEADGLEEGGLIPVEGSLRDARGGPGEGVEAKFEPGAQQACEPVLDAATPDIYRRNAFRITGLRVDSTAKEISRHADKLKMLAELGAEDEAAVGAAFALDPAPAVEQIREAAQRLKEPELRLVDEFFWFWPTSGEDPALRAIADGDHNAALNLWFQAEKAGGTDHIAAHNLAIALHLTALDWTAHQLDSTVDAAREQKIRGYWTDAWTRWRRLFEDDRIREQIRARIQSLDDPRLTTGFGRRLIETIPVALIKIHGELALQFAGQADAAWADFHVGMMREHSVSSAQFERAADRALAPAMNRLRQLMSDATRGSDADPQKGAKLAGELLDAGSPVASMVALFFGAGSPRHIDAADELATAALDCIISHQRATSDNKTFVAVLEQLLPLRLSPAVRQRVEHNIGIGSRNLDRQRLEPIYKLLDSVLEENAKATATTKLKAVQQQIIPLVIDAMEKFGAESSAVHALRDGVAAALRDISIAAYNTSASSEAVMHALLLASKLVVDAKLKEQIAKDLPVVEKFFKSRRCHYCEARPAGSGAAKSVNMYGDVRREWGRVRYRHTTITVARCNECREADRRDGWMIALFLLAGALFGGWLAPVLNPSNTVLCGVILGPVIGFVVSLVLKSIVNRQRSRRSDSLHPQIADLLRQGWSFGSSPGKYG